MLRFVLATAIIASGACKFPDLPPIDEDARVDASQGDGATPRYNLTLTIDGAGSGAGSISVEPGGFTCSSATCMRAYDAGAELTVTVAGASGVDGIVSVTGDCTTTPCSLAMDGDRAVTAQFVRYACAPSTTTCANGMFTECDATGNFVSHDIPNGMDDGTPLTIRMNNYACPMGCHASQPRCADISLGNGVEAAIDTARVSSTGQDIVLPKPSAPAGTIALSTTNFNSSAGTITITDTDGATMDLPVRVVVQGGEAGAVMVIQARTFTLRQGGVLRVTGSRSLGVATHFGTFIAGTIDASASLTSGGAPGARGMLTASCTGGGVPSAAGATGGAGGACTGGNSSTGIAGGPVSAVQPPFVVGGCLGGTNPNNPFDIPGLGGGGVLLVSRVRVWLAATAIINVAGSGGLASQNGGSARGGGSGGNLVAMAPLIRAVGGSIVSARGGGGGAASASTGASGSDGPSGGFLPAAGGMCSGCGIGGSGGYEAGCNGSNGTGSSPAIGAGGGSAGKCAFYSLNGAADVSSQATKCVRASEPLVPRSP